jgi:hypothetical protein
MFRFTLGAGQSIGARELLSLWEEACQVAHLSVGCVPGPSYADRLTYSLYAPHELMGLAGVEKRLWRLFGEKNLRVSLVASTSVTDTRVVRRCRPGSGQCEPTLLTRANSASTVNGFLRS